MKKILLLCAMLLFLTTGRAQQTTLDAFYGLPDTVKIDEIDLWEPLKTVNFEVVYCNYFVFTGKDSLVIVPPPNGKKVAFKGIALQFSGSPLFTGAVIFSAPFRKEKEMCLASIQLTLVDQTLIELDRKWLLEAGYYDTIYRIMEILQITTIKTIKND